MRTLWGRLDLIVVVAALAAAPSVSAQDIEIRPPTATATPAAAPIRGPTPTPTVDNRLPQQELWSLHVQSTVTEQFHPAFTSPFQGANSLDPGARGNETFDLTLYAGLRPWKGGEIWVDPEIDQGFGLSDTHGLASYPNGEGSKVGMRGPYGRLQRLFLRQTIDLGGERSAVAPDLNVLGGSQTHDRLVITVGKFSVVDVFDGNGYAHDARHDFMNWALIDTGSFDYAADAWGYTVGASAEWYTGDWALRLGLFDLSVVPNSEKLDPRFGQAQGLGEVERDYSLGGRSGKLRVTAYVTRGRMGAYDGALALAQAAGATPDTGAVRRYRSRDGIGLNLEQALSSDLGLFARAGTAQGEYEPYEYADIDQTAALGLQVKGTHWGRPDDVWGVGGEVASISKAHEAYLAAGGVGILVGDGKLPHPGAERIAETYYSIPLGKLVQLTGQYQLAVNPAYNRDRGPVSIFGLRVHFQR
jgi:high affinity Mn2+ porin